MTSTDMPAYTRTAIILHWLIAIAIVFMLILGWSFDYIPKGVWLFTLIQLHKSLGITILVLSLFRLAWRLTHQAPPLPASIPVWQRKAAHIGHIFLYVVMIGMPLSGWAMVSASPRNIPTILFGILPWPHLPILSTLVDKKPTADFLSHVHSYTAYILAILIAGHVAAALQHHLFARDETLLRITPRFMRVFLARPRGQE